MWGVALADWIAPRLDSPLQVCWTVLSVAVFVAAIVRWLTERRRGRRTEARDLWMLVHFSVDGVYLPIGPVVWLLLERRAARRRLAVRRAAEAGLSVSHNG